MQILLMNFIYFLCIGPPLYLPSTPEASKLHSTPLKYIGTPLPPLLKDIRSPPLLRLARELQG